MDSHDPFGCRIDIFSHFVQGSGLWVQGSALPLAGGAPSFIVKKLFSFGEKFQIANNPTDWFQGSEVQGSGFSVK
jgi:hypothetical protein